MSRCQFKKSQLLQPTVYFLLRKVFFSDCSSFFVENVDFFFSCSALGCFVLTLEFILYPFL